MPYPALASTMPGAIISCSHLSETTSQPHREWRLGPVQLGCSQEGSSLEKLELVAKNSTTPTQSSPVEWCLLQ